MPLTECSACDHRISAAAESCPQCGHPHRGEPQRGRKRARVQECYACCEPATTKCQACGELSCPEHLDHIWLAYAKGAYELRCESCYSSARFWNRFFWIGLAGLFGVMLIIMAVTLTTVR